MERKLDGSRSSDLSKTSRSSNNKIIIFQINNIVLFLIDFYFNFQSDSKDFTFYIQQYLQSIYKPISIDYHY